LKWISHHDPSFDKELRECLTAEQSTSQNIE
jgi:hypothetical protein